MVRQYCIRCSWILHSWILGGFVLGVHSCEGVVWHSGVVAFIIYVRVVRMWRVKEGGRGGVGFGVRIVIGVVCVLAGVTGGVRLIVLVDVLGADGLLVPVKKVEAEGVVAG